MLHLASLVCNGCEAIGKPNFFFDHSIKRPNKGECGHFLCDKCSKKNLRCPNCPEIECSKCTREVIKCDNCRRKPIDSPPEKCSNCIHTIIRCRSCSLHTYFKPTIIDGGAVINYGLLGLLEQYETDCIKVYRNWWKGAELGDIGCGNMGCKGGVGTRICLDCNGLDRVTPMKCLWVNKDGDKLPDYQKRMETITDKPKIKKEPKTWDPDDFFNLSSDSESEPEPEAPPPPFARYRLSVVLHKNHLTLLKSNLFCPDCFIETQKENAGEFEKAHRIGHKSIKLNAIEYLKEDVKRATAQYAGEFLWKIMKREADTKCKLRHMRLLRTCEVLIYLASISCPFIISQNFEPFGMREEGYWSHKREYSRVSKYFEALDFKKRPEKERIDLLIDSVEYQWNEYKKINENCDCNEKWHQLKKEKLGNQVEKHYCEMINNSGLEEKIDDCPGNWPRNLEILGNLSKSVEYWEKVNTSKLHLLPTIFCWNPQHSGQCHVFDNSSRKPCKCPRCGHSTCLDCLKTNFTLDCPICGCGFQMDFPKRIFYSPAVYNIDEQVMELVDYFKKNALEVLGNWWKFEVVPGEGYCMPCRSFSTQLELCTYCEYAQKECALSSSDLAGNISIQSQGASIRNLPNKWQCSECKPRLEAKWKHSDCEMINKKYERGCNHLRNRLNYGTCSSTSNCAQTIGKLRGFQKSESVWKAATWHIIRKLLLENSGRNEKDLDNLDSSIQEYFRIEFLEKQEKEEKTEKLKLAGLKRVIEEKIEKLNF